MALPFPIPIDRSKLANFTVFFTSLILMFIPLCLGHLVWDIIILATSGYVERNKYIRQLFTEIFSTLHMTIGFYEAVRISQNYKTLDTYLYFLAWFIFLYYRYIFNKHARVSPHRYASEQFAVINRYGRFAIVLVLAQFLTCFITFTAYNYFTIHYQPYSRFANPIEGHCDYLDQVSILSGMIIEGVSVFFLDSMIHLFVKINFPYNVGIWTFTQALLKYMLLGLTGGIFNPALALAAFYGCRNFSIIQLFLVYWVSPVVGGILSAITLKYMKPNFKFADLPKSS